MSAFVFSEVADIVGDLKIESVGSPYVNPSGTCVFDVSLSLEGSSKTFCCTRFVGDLPHFREGMIFRSGEFVGWDPEEQELSFAAKDLSFIGYEDANVYRPCLGSNQFCAVYQSPAGKIAIPCMAVPYSFFLCETQLVKRIFRGWRIESVIENVSGNLCSASMSVDFFPGVNIDGLSRITRLTAILCCCSSDFRETESRLYSSCMDGTPLRITIPKASSDMMTLVLHGSQVGDTFLAARLDYLNSPLRCRRIHVRPAAQSRRRTGRKRTGSASHISEPESAEVLSPLEAGYARKSEAIKIKAPIQVKPNTPRFEIQRSGPSQTDAGHGIAFAAGAAKVSTGGSGHGAEPVADASILPGGAVNIGSVPGFELFCGAIAEVSRMRPELDVSVSGGDSSEVSSGGFPFDYAYALIGSEFSRWHIFEFHFHSGKSTFTLVIPEKSGGIAFSKRTVLEIMCRNGEYSSRARMEFVNSFMYAYTLKHFEGRSAKRWGACILTRLRLR